MSSVIGVSRRRLLPWLVLIAAGGALGATVLEDRGRSGREAVGRGATLHGTVTRVVDGDTIHVRVDGRRVKVRYIGVDTPESHRPDTPVQCFAREATAANARLVAGEEVVLRTDAEPRDRYDRLLAYVTRRRDGLFVNAALVRDGFARILTIPPNVRYERAFGDLERGARARGAGLWSRCGP